MPVRADSSELPSAVARASKASSTTRPFASVVAKPASPALSASTASAEADGTSFGRGRGEEGMPQSMAEIAGFVHLFLQNSTKCQIFGQYSRLVEPVTTKVDGAYRQQGPHLKRPPTRTNPMLMNRRHFTSALVAGAAASLISTPRHAAAATPAAASTRIRNVVLVHGL